MPEYSSFKSLAPFHIISYGTLLGTEFFQTFVGGIVSYRALPRAQFSQLQQKLFPVYFIIQTAAPVVLALTYPGPKNALSPLSSFQGVFADVNRWTVLAPLAIVFVTSLTNTVFIGPATTKVMKDRKTQETRDGKKYHDAGPQSDAMKSLNAAFSTMHGLSSALNLAGYIATLWYGFSLAARIE